MSFPFSSRKRHQKQSSACISRRTAGESVRKHSVPLRRRRFGVFSKPEGIVHCGLILVTLLGKASLGPVLRAHFKCLALVWSFVAPRALLPAHPRALWQCGSKDLAQAWAQAPTSHLSPLACQGHSTAIAAANPFSPPSELSESASVFYLCIHTAVHRHSTPHPHLHLFLLPSTPTSSTKVARQREKDSAHIYTPRCL